MRALLERRGAIRDELKNICEQHPDDLPEAAQERWDALTGEADAPQHFDGDVLRAQSGERLPLLGRQHRLSDFVPQTETRSAAADLGFGGFIRAVYNGPRSELERRALAEGAPGTGGVTVPTVLAAQILDAVRARAVAFRAGARVLPMSSQTVKIARVTAYPVGTWRAELAAIATDQPAFDALTLTAKSWALLVRCSRELVEDGTNLDAALRDVFAASAAYALDQAVLFGSGTSNAPTGVFNMAGLPSISLGVNGAALSATTAYGLFLDAVALLEASNSEPPTAAVYSPRTSRALNGFLDGTGQPLNPPPAIAGIPRLVSNAVPNNLVQGSASNASAILIGDWSQVLVGMRTELTISTLNERFADTGEIGFVLWMRADVGLARPGMARIIGITP